MPTTIMSDQEAMFHLVGHPICDRLSITWQNSDWHCEGRVLIVLAHEPAHREIEWDTIERIVGSLSRKAAAYSPIDSYDLSQEVMCKLLESGNRHREILACDAEDNDVCRQRANWLWTVVANRHIDMLRKVDRERACMAKLAEISYLANSPVSPDLLAGRIEWHRSFNRLLPQLRRVLPNKLCRVLEAIRESKLELVDDETQYAADRLEVTRQRFRAEKTRLKKWIEKQETKYHDESDFPDWLVLLRRLLFGPTVVTVCLTVVEQPKPVYIGGIGIDKKDFTVVVTTPPRGTAVPHWHQQFEIRTDTRMFDIVDAGERHGINTVHLAVVGVADNESYCPDVLRYRLRASVRHAVTGRLRDARAEADTCTLRVRTSDGKYGVPSGSRHDQRLASRDRSLPKGDSGTRPRRLRASSSIGGLSPAWMLN